jgi:hypothetical protein
MESKLSNGEFGFLAVQQPALVKLDTMNSVDPIQPQPAPEHQDAQPSALTPEIHTGLKIGHRHQKAAGVAAIAKSMEHLARDSGLVRGNMILLQMNQKDGFDCPGCAWPDPEDERSRFEYCGKRRESYRRGNHAQTRDAAVFRRAFGERIGELERPRHRKIGAA